MIHRINLVQNYSSKFGNSQQQFTVTDGGVKSFSPIQPTTKNNNYNKSDETKCEINYSIITNNKWNDVNTHINMQLTMHNKYTDDDVHTDSCVVHIVR